MQPSCMTDASAALPRSSSDLANPFVHTLELTTNYERIRTGLLTIIYLPVRLAIILTLLVLAWLLAVGGLIGLTEDELHNKPLRGYRRKIREMIAWLIRVVYEVGGMKVVVKGRQASRKEAPIMVAAPHSTFLDAGIVYITGFPSIICRNESGSNPWLGKLINYTQPIYVRRDDPDSRHQTIQQTINRVNSPDDWAQLLIFPEGTCTNRSCLITFKPGAFYPGVPVQPVLIRYPNKLDTVTWTWEGPGALKLLWLTLAQPVSNCEVEFLPVYHPSDDEKNNPKLYANNVRKLMAKHLGVPTVDYTYDDCKLITRAKMLSPTDCSTFLNVQKHRIKLGLSRSQAEEKLLKEKPDYLREDANNRYLNFTQFSQLLKIEKNNPSGFELFSLYDHHKRGLIDMREYLLSVLLVNRAENKAEMMHRAFELLGDKKRCVSREDCTLILGLVLNMSPDDSSTIINVISNNDAKISLDSVKTVMKKQGEASSISRELAQHDRIPSEKDNGSKKSL